VHRSRLIALGIDVPAADFEAQTAFWAGALGAEPEADEDGTYQDLGRHGGLLLFTQRLGDGDARVHLDIETDDVEAEVARLETLGASRLRQVSSWWILRDPAGLEFCIVPPQSGDFPAGATEWP
jgi:catechol 2,3-dioxygenase-like lactoylglutathione lyase family enzyme